MSCSPADRADAAGGFRLAQRGGEIFGFKARILRPGYGTTMLPAGLTTYIGTSKGRNATEVLSTSRALPRKPAQD